MLLTNIAKNINWWLMFEVTRLDGTKVNVSEWVQNFNMPALTLGTSEIPYNQGNFKVPTNVPDWGQIDVQFLLDENWEIYTLVLDWMFANAKDRPSFGNIVAIALDSYQRPVFRYTFGNLIPSNIGAVEMNVSMENENIAFNVAIDYSQFSYKKLGVGGMYKIGAGEGTRGSYLENGTSSVSNENIITKSKIFSGKLLKNDQAGLPWDIELVGDDWPSLLDDGTKQISWS